MVGPSSFFPFRRWPNGTVTYELHTSLTPPDVIEVLLAIYDIQNKTCIRFVPRAENDTDYVSVERDDTLCGLAHVCKLGGYQFARFGQQCKRMSVMVHEFGHTLCLGHEMTRIDRDEYTGWDHCPEGTEIYPRDDLVTGGHFYDYVSQMNYECSWCPGAGRPKMEGVTDMMCGMDVQEGLSVLDADKINDLYDCQGCLNHRWRRTETLTDIKKHELVSFGKTVEYKDVHLCRTYIRGEIAPGQYNLDTNICTVTLNGTEFQIKSKVQVFIVHNENVRKRYRMSESKINLIPVGRTGFAMTIYAAMSEYEDYKGRYGQVIGKVYANDFSKAYFAINNVEVTKIRFLVLVCN